MLQKTDILTQSDIKKLVDTFYISVEKDKTIGFIFTDIIKVDWKHHLPKMYAFWSGILFGNGGFSGNPMLKHMEIDKAIPLNETEFAAWLSLWTKTVDDLFVGENANEAKLRGSNIARMMLQKITMAR